MQKWLHSSVRVFGTILFGLLGVLLADLLTWVSQSPLWYYAFVVDALVFVAAILTVHALVRLNHWEKVKNRLSSAPGWLLDVLLGALLTIGVNTLQVPSNLEGTTLIWTATLLAAITMGSLGIALLEHALKPDEPPSAPHPHTSNPHAPEQ